MSGGEVDDLVKIGEAARLLGVCQATLRKREAQGVVASVRVGKDRQYRRADVIRWAAERTVTNEPVRTAPTVEGMLSIGDAARRLGVSERILRAREDAGVIQSARSSGGHRMYRTEDVETWAQEGTVRKQHSGRPARKRAAAPRHLSYDDERECEKIAHAVSWEIVNRVRGEDRDEVLSDALVGVAYALSIEPVGDIPWNVAVYTHAKYHAQRGVQRRLGWHGTVERGDARRPVSLDALIEVYGEYFGHPSESAGRIETRVALEEALTGIAGPERVALVNAAAHCFTDLEIAYDMGVESGDVRRMRQQATEKVRHRVAALFDDSTDWTEDGA